MRWFSWKDRKIFCKYCKLNTIKIKIDNNKILTNLQKYQKENYIYQFVDERILFSTRIRNYTSVFFITCNGLNDPWSMLGLSTKKFISCLVLYKIGIWGVSNWVSISLTESDNPLDSDHFAFGFETKNLKYLVNFTFLLLKEKAKLVNFIHFEINSFLLSLRIQILNWYD